MTDVERIRQAMTVMRFLLPGDIRLFSIGEAAAARRWIVEDRR